MAELQRVGTLLGLRSLAVRYPNGLPSEGASPAVVPIVNRDGRQHFVALAGIHKGRALIVNLPYPATWVTEDDLRIRLRWAGEALHFAADDKSIATVREQIDVECGTSRDSLIMIASAAFAAVGACLIAIVSKRRRPDTGGEKSTAIQKSVPPKTQDGL